MVDAFELKEREGRNKLKEKLDTSKKIEKYEFTEEKFNPIDCFATGVTGGKICYEIKNRDIDIDKYKKEGFMLEYKKYQRLMEYNRLSGGTSYYINFFQDGKGISWDVSRIKDAEDRVEIKYCTETTAEDYEKGKVPKEVIMLKAEEGIVFNYGNEE